MKCSIDLYINSNKVDIINSEQFAQQFAITQSFSDLYEPDKIVDSYSKSLTLPGTARNNAIFGHIWKLDSNNITAFNPSQLSDFQIFLNNELWQTGTVQLQEISIQNNVISYKIVLYGSITKVMSMLLNSDIEDESNKLLRSLKFPGNNLRHPLTGLMLYRMWHNGSYYTGTIYLQDYMQYVPCQNGLYDNFDSTKKLMYYYPWANTHGNHGNPYITCKPVIYADTQSPGVSDVQVKVASSEDAEFDEYTLKQYRVEYQRPAIKMNKLIEQIVKDASTDASINLGTDFFHVNNPYFTNTYLTLSQYTTDDDEGDVTASIDTYSTKYINTSTTDTYWDLAFTQTGGEIQIFDTDSSTVVYMGALSGTKKLSLEFQMKVSVLSDIKLPKGDYANEPIYYNGEYFGYVDQRIKWNELVIDTWNVYARAYSGAYSANSTPYTDGNYDASVHSGIYTRNRVSTSVTAYCPFTYETYNNNYPSYPYQYTRVNGDIHNATRSLWPSYTPVNDPNYYWKPFKLTIDFSTLNNAGTIRINLNNIAHSFVGINDMNMVRRINVNLPVLVSIKGITAAPESASSSALNNYYPYSYGYTGNGANVSYNRAIRSGDNSGGTYSGIAPSVVTAEDMFDTTTTQGEILLNYTKLLGLVYDVARDGSITIRSRNDYFSDYEIIDWSDKVDYSREFKVKPIPFNTRYLEMKYKSGGTYYENKYSNEFGLEYGEKKINTGFAFNSETTQLLDSIFNNTVIAEDPRAEYGTQFRYITSSGTLDDNYYGFVVKLWDNNPFAMPAYFTKDGEKKSPADIKYSLLFNKGKQSNPGDITVDSSLMLSSDASIGGGKYCWVSTDSSSYNTDSIRQLIYSFTYMPQFSTHYDNYSWDIGYPRISYASDTSETYPSGSTVYSRFWDTYISEIYNVRNKIITCYVKLSWIDILNFSFKNFVTINGVLYHPNKLLNVNPLSDDPVQVELIQVQNVDAYAYGQNIPGTITRTRPRRVRPGIVIEEDEE